MAERSRAVGRGGDSGERQGGLSAGALVLGEGVRGLRSSGRLKVPAGFARRRDSGNASTSNLSVIDAAVAVNCVFHNPLKSQ